MSKTGCCHLLFSSFFLSRLEQLYGHRTKNLQGCKTRMNLMEQQQQQQQQPTSNNQQPTTNNKHQTSTNSQQPTANNHSSHSTPPLKPANPAIHKHKHRTGEPFIQGRLDDIFRFDFPSRPSNCWGVWDFWCNQMFRDGS